MGKAVVIFRVTPRDMDKVRETIKQVKGLRSCRVVDVQEQPIGFGVIVLRVAVVVPEKEDKAVGKAERALKELELVEAVEQQEMTLV